MFRMIGGDGQEYGPVPAAQVKEWIVEGRADGQTLVRREGSQDWQQLSAIPELSGMPSSGSLLPPPLPPSPVSNSDPAMVIIPYKNMPALISYYLAVFSIVPCVGILLGFAAVVLGIMGLKRASERPEARGKVHAWVGIVLGALCGVGWIVAMLLLWAAGARQR
jgi:hypothetical protein